MKKFFAAIIISFIFVGVVSAFEAGAAKISERNNQNYRVLNGFDFANYVGSEKGLEVIVDNEIKKVITDDKKEGYKGKYAVIGYSQGGERSLAYATRLKAQNPEEFKRLEAVITVSGVDKGLKALEGGFGPLKARAGEDVNILYNGYEAVKDVSPIFSIAGGCVEFLLDVHKEVIIDKIGEFAPGIIDYVKAAWNGGTENQLKELYDMMPNSNFIQKNVSVTEKKTAKRISGYNTEWYWDTSFFIPLLKTRQVPVYEYYDYFYDSPKFSNDLPVGYIVGLNSNTLSMINSKNSTTNESIARGCLKAAEIGFGAAQIHYIGTCVLLYGLFNGNVTKATYCNSAREWVANIDGELNEIKNSTQNDGLVAKESQFYPKTYFDVNTNQNKEVHSKVLSTSDIGYEEFPEYNHMTISPLDNEVIQTRIKDLLNKTRRK